MIHSHMVFILLNGNEASPAEASAQGRIAAVAVK